MAVTTRLTWKEEKSLQQLLGNVSLRLLYKSRVHGDSPENMLRKCALQGSTITVIYFHNSQQDCILGYLTVIDYDFIKPKVFFYSSFEKDETSKTKAACLNTTQKITDEELAFYSSDNKIFSVIPKNSRLFIHDVLRERLGLNLYSNFKYSEWEVFRLEGIKDVAGYVRKRTRATERRNELLEDLRAYKPYADLVSEIRILLLGPVGSGKSSFFNSVKSVFQGHVTRQAAVGADLTSITELYRVYPIKDGEDGKSLSFMLCDSMGLDEKKGAGLCLDDIPYILKGCIPDRYQFSPHKPVTPSHPTFITSLSLKERIHCVAYVLDINSISNLSSNMVAKLKQVHKEVLNCGIAHVALLTKVNNYDEVLQDDLLNMSKSMTSKTQVMNIQRMLNIPISNILMVENYASELTLNPLKDVLILSVLKQMLRAADDFLQDLP